MDRAAIRGMVEEYWRAYLPVAFSGDRSGAIQMVMRFQQQIDDMAAVMPEGEERNIFLLVVDLERGNIADEYDRDPRALKHRLGVPDQQAKPTARAAQSQGMAFGEVAVRTAVRATVWETVFSLFRLFRR